MPHTATAQNSLPDIAPQGSNVHAITPAKSNGFYAQYDSSKPNGWILVDRSNDISNFSVTHTNIRQKPARRASKKQPTEGDDLVQAYATQLEVDPIGGEDFSTAMETAHVGNIYGSLHYMFLGGSAQQKFHYHPPADNDKTFNSSRRLVLLYPLFDRATGNNQGVTFKWFETTKTQIVKQEDQKYRFAQGNPVSPMYSITAKPGQVVLVEFPKGIHCFQGLGMAISAHFMDVATGNPLGSFLGNTAGWEGDVPEEVTALDFHNNPYADKSDLLKTGSVKDIFFAHALAMRERVEKHIYRLAGEPLSQEHLYKKVLKDLSI
jgi:hypothetical protein